MIQLTKEYFILHMAAFFAGCILDLIIGDPHRLPHPVAGIGKLIAALEKKLYPGKGQDSERKAFSRGALLTVIVIVTVFAVTAAVIAAAYRIDRYLGAAAEAVLTCYILAAKSLYTESMKVYGDLRSGDIDQARYDLSMIVGRDTQRLDVPAIARAAVETVAENTSDGVIAPLLYTAVGGPVLGMTYKAVNTMDSMLGYRNERYEYFGRAAAKTDDAVNYIPSRLSALLMIAAAALHRPFSKFCDPARAYRIWKRDRRNHKSPNSAQTESVCAGALGLRLGGSSYYKGVLSEKPYIGDDDRAIEAEDIRRANRLMFTAEAAVLVILLCLTLLLI